MTCCTGWCCAAPSRRCRSTLQTISPGIFFEADDFQVTRLPGLPPRPDSLGYMFEEKSRRPFLPEKAEELGMPPGPWRRDLVAGKTVTLPDGRMIEPDDGAGRAQRPGPGWPMSAMLGEPTTWSRSCAGADALVIEATYLEEEREMAQQFSHLTATQAAELAKGRV